MANFEIDRWYQLYLNQDNNHAFAGTELERANGTEGAVFYRPSNTSAGQQWWQLYSMDDTYYVLRTRAGGPDAYLGARYAPQERTPGQTRAYMIQGNISDDSVFWKISPWGDGTFYLTNKQNGTEWNLGRTMNGQNVTVVLDSNKTDTPATQRFSFRPLDKIAPKGYSTVALPNLSTSASASPFPTVSSPSNGSNGLPANNSGSDSNGLSTGAKAAIGASVGGAAFIALIVLGLFLLRRRRNDPDAVEKSAEGDSNSQRKERIEPQHEMNDETIKYEMSGTQNVAELPEDVRPVELEGDGAVVQEENRRNQRDNVCE